MLEKNQLRILQIYAFQPLTVKIQNGRVFRSFSRIKPNFLELGTVTSPIFPLQNVPEGLNFP